MFVFLGSLGAFSFLLLRYGLLEGERRGKKSREEKEEHKRRERESRRVRKRVRTRGGNLNQSINDPMAQIAVEIEWMYRQVSIIQYTTQYKGTEMERGTERNGCAKEAGKTEQTGKQAGNNPEPVV